MEKDIPLSILWLGPIELKSLKTCLTNTMVSYTTLRRLTLYHYERDADEGVEGMSASKETT